MQKLVELTVTLISNDEVFDNDTFILDQLQNEESEKMSERNDEKDDGRKG